MSAWMERRSENGQTLKAARGGPHGSMSSAWVAFSGGLKNGRTLQSKTITFFPTDGTEITC